MTLGILQVLEQLVLISSNSSFPSGRDFHVCESKTVARKDHCNEYETGSVSFYFSKLFFSIRALQESFLTRTGNSHSSSSSETSSFERDLQLAMELSVREQEEQEKQRKEKEDAELQQVLQLSLVEK